MFKIGDFSKLTNVTVRALHHYENIALLVPKKTDEITGYRYYSAEQLETMNKIKMLQNIGLSLKKIKEILYSNHSDALSAFYELRKLEIEEEISTLQIKQQLLNEYSKKIQIDIHMEKYHVERKEIPSRRVMSLRKVISTFNDEGTLWETLYTELIRQSVKMSTQSRGMTLYHDKEYIEPNVDVEVQSEVVGDYHDTEEIKFFEAPQFTMASVTFNGSYDQMGEVSQVIGVWIGANSYELAGPMIIISHVSPAQESNPDKWVTEAGYIIRKIRVREELLWSL